jgi:hypothetical protein
VLLDKTDHLTTLGLFLVTTMPSLTINKISEQIAPANAGQGERFFQVVTVHF